jgi:hypothetical protein
MDFQKDNKAFDRMRLAMALLSVVILVVGILEWRQNGHTWILALFPVTALFILLLASKITASAAIFGKLIFDVALVSSHLFVNLPDFIPLYGIIYLCAFCWFMVNVCFLENRVVHGLLLLFISSPFLHKSVIWARGGAAPEPIMFFAAFLPIAAHVLWVVRAMDKERREDTLAELERRSRQVEDFRRWSRTSGALLLHDARNILQATEFVDAAVAQGQCPAQVGEQIRRMKHQILTALENHDREERVRFLVASTLRRMFQAAPPGLSCFELRVDAKACLVYHPQVFESLVYNLARNAWEAWHEKTGSWRGLRIIVSFSNEELVMEDNAGGFDPSTIQNGGSRKGPGHGVFLATVQQQQEQLGIRFSLERIASGMRARIVFPADAPPEDAVRQAIAT